MKAQVLEAKMNWLPQGTLLSLLAPSPKRALADLERRKEYLDLVIIAGAVLARAQDVDNPNNAFHSHYHDGTAAGVAAGLRLPLDARDGGRRLLRPLMRALTRRSRALGSGCDDEMIRPCGPSFSLGCGGQVDWERREIPTR